MPLSTPLNNLEGNVKETDGEDEEDDYSEPGVDEKDESDPKLTQTNPSAKVLDVGVAIDDEDEDYLDD